MGAAGRSRPRPAARRPTTASRCASSAGRSAPTRTSTRRSRQFVGDALGLAPVPATQVIARDRHAEYLYACASVGCDVRADRGRAPPPAAHRGARGRKRGSSRARRARRRCRTSATRSRPRRSRVWRACSRQSAGRPAGRGAVARARHLALLGRADRPARLVAAGVLRAAAAAPIARGSWSFPERMLANLDASHGLVFSQPVLLALVQAGLTRDDAYRIVQRNAMQAWDEGRRFPNAAGSRRRGRQRRARRRVRSASVAATISRHVLDQVEHIELELIGVAGLTPVSRSVAAADAGTLERLAGTPTSRHEAYEIDLLSE